MGIETAIGFAAAGALSSAMQASSNTKSQNKVLKYQAERNRINARLEKLQAEAAFDRGAKQEQQIQIAASKQKGQQRVGYGANGIRLDSRSVQQVLNETEYMAQVDELQTHANALAEAWQHRLNAVNYENNADIQLSQQQSPGKAALSAGLNSLLQSGMSMAMTYGLSSAKAAPKSKAQASFQIGNKFDANSGNFPGISTSWSWWK